MTDVQLLRGGSWESVDFSDFKIEAGISQRMASPQAEIEIAPRESVSANQDARILIDGITRFSGKTESGGTKRENSPMKVKLRHDAAELFNSTASVYREEGDAANQVVLSDAINDADTQASYTLDYQGTSDLLDNDYIVNERPVIDIFRDIMDRTNQVWWVSPEANTIRVDGKGEAGTFASLDAETDRVVVESFDTGSVETVRNDVTVIGTGAGEVVGTAEDTTSQANYGKRSTRVSIQYATSQAEADKIAESLIQADPAAEGEILVGRNVGSIEQSHVNETLDLTDDSKGISETGLVIEKQTILQGHAKFSIGEGIGTSIAEANRGDRTKMDSSPPSTSGSSTPRGVIIAAKGQDEIGSGSTLEKSTGIDGPGQDDAVLTPVGNFAGDSGPDAVHLHYTDPGDAASGVSMSLEWNSTSSEYLLNISNDHSSSVTIDWAVVKIPTLIQNPPPDPNWTRAGYDVYQRGWASDVEGPGTSEPTRDWTYDGGGGDFVEGIPVIGSDSVFFQANDSNNDGFVYAIDKSDGSEVWSTAWSTVFDADTMANAQPILYDGNVWALSSDGIAAFDASDGSEVDSRSSGSGSEMQPTYNDGFLYYRSGTVFEKYDMDANTIDTSTTNLTGGQMITFTDTLVITASDSSVEAAPISDITTTEWTYNPSGSIGGGPQYSPDADLVIIGVEDNGVTAIDPADGSQSYQKTYSGDGVPNPPWSSLGMTDSVGIMGWQTTDPDGGYVSFDLSDGSFNWSTSTGTPATADGWVTIDENGIMYAERNNSSGQIVSLKVSDGTENWSVNTNQSQNRGASFNEGALYAAQSGSSQATLEKWS